MLGRVWLMRLVIKSDKLTKVIHYISICSLYVNALLKVLYMKYSINLKYEVRLKVKPYNYVVHTNDT